MADGTTSNGTYMSQSGLRKRRRFKDKIKQCFRYMHNREEKTWCGRTSRSWILILCYYTWLVLVIALMMILFMAYIYTRYYQSHEPAYKKIRFMPYSPPGVTFYPTHINGYDTIFWYTSKGEDALNNRRSSAYIKEIDKIFQEARKLCEMMVAHRKCAFVPETFGPCGVPDYGFDKDQPCIYLKLNKLIDWIPEPYGNLSNVQSFVPVEIKRIIEPKTAKLYVFCSGVDAHSKDIIGEVEYHPEPVFNQRYFPKKYGENLPIIMAIQLANVKKGYVAVLECTLAAKNIKKPHKEKTIVFIKD